MNDNKKTKIKTAKAIIAAATIMVVIASVAMIGIQTQMSQHALAQPYSTTAAHGTYHYKSNTHAKHGTMTHTGSMAY